MLLELIGIFKFLNLFFKVLRQVFDTVVALHFERVHTADAVVGVAAGAAFQLTVLELVDEVGVVNQCARHLHSRESFGQTFPDSGYNLR